MFAAGVPLVEALDSVGARRATTPTRGHEADQAGSVHRHLAHYRDAERERVPQHGGADGSIGEETGALDAMLGKVADFYEQEVDDAVEALSSLMEPMIMVVLGTLDRRHGDRDVLPIQMGQTGRIMTLAGWSLQPAFLPGWRWCSGFASARSSTSSSTGCRRSSSAAGARHAPSSPGSPYHSRPEGPHSASSPRSACRAWAPHPRMGERAD